MKNDNEKNKKDEEKATSEDTDRILELEDKVKEFEDKWKRAVADYQNQEKWVREKKSDWVKSANRDLLLRILPVLDTLTLAALHTEDKNIQVSIDQFLAILKDEGVVRIDAVGKEFDPYLMEAISTTEGEENKVLKELRAGYMLFDTVLRPAQVVVGKSK